MRYAMLQNTRRQERAENEGGPFAMAMMHYKTGRIHDHLPPPVPDLATYATKPLPAPPDEVDVPGANLKNWGMDLNDTYGDCTIAGADHIGEADCAVAKEQYHAPSSAVIERTYFGLTGGADSGLVMSAVLKAWRATGLFGQKLAAYAPVHAQNTTLVQQCIAWFGAAYIGVNLPKPAEGQFSPDGTGVWDLTGTSADNQIEGGHCVAPVGYRSDGSVQAVTWGAIVTITPAWWSKYVEEVWATITEPFVLRSGDARGLSLSTLEADLAAA